MLQQGYATFRQDYDERGNVRRQTFYDASDHPCLSSDGWHGWEQEHDEQGRETRNTFLGIDGQPLSPAAFGYATRRQAYDDAGGVRRITYFDAANQPCATLNYDKDGNPVEGHDSAGRSGKPLQIKVVVEGVVPGGQAESLGLRPEDAVLGYAGRKITSYSQFVQLVGATKAARIPLDIERKGKLIKLTVKPGRIGIETHDRMLPAASPPPPREKRQ